jgi:arginine decarboxylase
MWQAPRAVSLVAGHGEGGSEINAFDRALQDAGVADLNFMRVTSILPPGTRIIELPPYPPGILMPSVYARIVSTTPGDRIAAAVGVGVCRESHGVIMEHTGHAARAEAEQIVRRMIVEGFQIRRLPLHEVVIVSAEHVVERAGCAVALALFWPAATGMPRQPAAGPASPQDLRRPRASER